MRQKAILACVSTLCVFLAQAGLTAASKNLDNKIRELTTEITSQLVNQPQEEIVRLSFAGVRVRFFLKAI